MKLSLVVITAGKMQGKSISIAVPEFMIGRDPECHLRPASPLISKKHCAFIVHGEKATIRDFGSTNGTMLNNEPITGDRPIANGDLVKVGPIEFRVDMELAPAPVRRTPSPRSMPSEADDATAAALLSLGDDESGSSVDGQGVPTGGTMGNDQIPMRRFARRNGCAKARRRKQERPHAAASPGGQYRSPPRYLENTCAVTKLSLEVQAKTLPPTLPPPGPICCHAQFASCAEIRLSPALHLPR